MNIPTIGGTRGVFEIFVPGAFLLLNLAAVVYLLPFIDEDTKSFISGCGSTPALSLVIILCFGYLIGVILRLFRAEPVDKLSAKLNMKFNSHACQDGTCKPWAYEEFPYIDWIGEVCKLYLPPETIEFYYNTWAGRKREGRNRQFFNFCKTIINSVDERAANEIHSAEALSLYISGTFYSLVIASCLLSATVALHFHSFGKIITPLLLIIVVYLLAIAAILRYFRFIRIKEVEIVFAATFIHRSIFYGELATSGNTV